MGYIYEHLNEYLCDFNIELSEKQLSLFEQYYELLIEWNQKINLTSIIEPREVCIKHFADSLSVSQFYSFNNEKVIDIGTGGGFPGIPLKIMYPDLDVVLLDSLNKRINFLNLVIDNLQLSHISCIHGRAEDFAHNKLYREKFDICVSRAVANMSTLAEYCLPFVKVGGKFISYKAEYLEEESNAADNAIRILGGKVSSVNRFVFSEDEFDRTFVIVDKDMNTSKKYPRKAGTPSKQPL